MARRLPSISLSGEQVRYAGDLRGACELAASLLMAVNWTADRPLGADIGQRTQVRILSQPHHRGLLIRHSDLERYGNVPYMLVRPEWGERERNRNRFSIVGWMMGREATKVGKRLDSPQNNKPPMWLVENYLLRPITQLENP